MKLFIFLLLSFFSFPILAQKTEKTTPTKRQSIVLGNSLSFFSTSLNERRTINIYLPEGYNPKDSLFYPVIYLLDGSLDEDFIHISGLMQFNSFDWVNRMPKAILVGIATVDRRRDFTFPTSIIEDQKRFPTTGKSTNFISFIEKELQPFISKKYKTSGSNTIIGQSLGGLLISEILMTKPYMFDNYGIISPSIWWNDGSILNLTFPQIKNKNIYIAVGKEGQTPSQKPRIMEEDAELLSKILLEKADHSNRIHFDYLPEENHATIFHLAASKGFTFLFKK